MLLKRQRRPMKEKNGVCSAWEITWALLGPGNELWWWFFRNGGWCDKPQLAGSFYQPAAKSKIMSFYLTQTIFLDLPLILATFHSIDANCIMLEGVRCY